MEYDTKEIADIIKTHSCNVSASLRALQEIPKIRKVKTARKAFWTEEQKEAVINLYKVRAAFPNKSIAELMTMNDQIVKAGFKKIEIKEAPSNPLVTNPKFNILTYFPSWEEITPYQFQEI